MEKAIENFRSIFLPFKIIATVLLAFQSFTLVAACTLSYHGLAADIAHHTWQDLFATVSFLVFLFAVWLITFRLMIKPLTEDSFSAAKRRLKWIWCLVFVQFVIVFAVMMMRVHLR